MNNKVIKDIIKDIKLKTSQQEVLNATRANEFIISAYENDTDFLNIAFFDKLHSIMFHSLDFVSQNKEKYATMWNRLRQENLIKYNFQIGHTRNEVYKIKNEEHFYEATWNGIDRYPAKFVDMALNDIINEYKENIKNSKSDSDKLKVIFNFHLEFEAIHPFIDGNRRTGRAIMTLMLLNNGFAPFGNKKDWEKNTEFYNDLIAYSQSAHPSVSTPYALLKVDKDTMMNKYFNWFKNEIEKNRQSLGMPKLKNE